MSGFAFGVAIVICVVLIATSRKAHAAPAEMQCAYDNLLGRLTPGAVVTISMQAGRALPRVGRECVVKAGACDRIEYVCGRVTP
jgi:hypothetical protein